MSSSDCFGTYGRGIYRWNTSSRRGPNPIGWKGFIPD